MRIVAAASARNIRTSKRTAMALVSALTRGVTQGATLGAAGARFRARPVAAPGRVLASVSQHDAARSRRHAAEPLRASALAALRP